MIKQLAFTLMAALVGAAAALWVGTSPPVAVVVTPAPLHVDPPKPTAPRPQVALQVAPVKIVKQEPQEAERTQALVETLEVRLDREARDPGWSAKTEDEIREVFFGAEGTRLTATDCRATLCRIELSYDNALAQGSLLRTIGRAPAFNGAGLARQDGLHTTLYVAREGHPLPSID